MIREADKRDVFALTAYGAHFWKQSPYGDTIPYNPQAVRDLLTWMIEDQYLYLAVAGTEITGFLGLVEAPLLFNPDYDVVTEVFFYVRPDYRKQGISKELYAYADADIDTDILAFADMSSSTDMDEYYTQLGFTHTERTYTKVKKCQPSLLS